MGEWMPYVVRLRRLHGRYWWQHRRGVQLPRTIWRVT